MNPSKTSEPTLISPGRDMGGIPCVDHARSASSGGSLRSQLLSTFNISQAIAGVSERALIVLPMALLIIAREIDLSVASTLALTSVIFGMLIQANAPLAVSIVLTLVAGALWAHSTGIGDPVETALAGGHAGHAGDVSGHRLHPFGLGVGEVFSRDALTNFGIDNVLGSPLPWTIVPFLVLAPIFAIVLQKTPHGQAHLRDRRQSGNGALFGDPSAQDNSLPVHHLGAHQRDCRDRLHRPARQCPSQ